jgi:hypothetical protein
VLFDEDSVLTEFDGFLSYFTFLIVIDVAILKVLSSIYMKGLMSGCIDSWNFFLFHC